MKHFTTEEWIDFVNQMIPDERRKAMEQHLQSGCKRCAKELHIWEKVRDIAAKESSLQPPSEALQWVKAAYRPAPAKAERKASVIEVLFDSFLQPAMAGTRAAANGSRQMLYRAGSYQIDIQIEVKPGSNVLVIAGQIMDVSNPDSASHGVAITLSNLHGHVIYTSTNEFGEFRAEIQNSGDLELSIPRHGGNPITISLRNALSQLPGEKT